MPNATSAHQLITLGQADDRYLSWINPRSFGVKGDGVTDDLAAILLAVAAGNVMFDIGTFLVSDEIPISVTGRSIGGLGRLSNIKTTSATANIFTVSAQFVHIWGVYMNASVTRTAGWYVDFTSSANRSRLSNFSMDGAIGGWRTVATATATIESGDILNCVASTGIAMRVNGGVDVTIRDILVDSASQIFAAVYIAATGDTTIEDCNLIHGGNCVQLVPGAGQVVSSVWLKNSYFDTSTRGLLVNPNGAAASVVRCMASDCWFSSGTAHGVLLDTAAGGIIDGFDFNACHVFLNGQDGINILDTGCTNIRINGGEIAGNTGAGVSIGADVSEWSVNSARIGPTGGLGANGYGIFLNAGASANFNVYDNDLRGNTTNNLAGASGVTGANWFIRDNNGAPNRGRLPWAQGATVASANNLTLGYDGSYFQISGNTQINLINATDWNGGTIVTLKFNSTPTVKHNQAVSGTNKPILLAGAADFVATANDTLTLRYDSTDAVWYQVATAVI